MKIQTNVLPLFELIEIVFMIVVLPLIFVGIALLWFKDKLRKITGFSTTLGGVSWDSSINEKKIAQHVIVFLEDRRLLFTDAKFEFAIRSIDSANSIRRHLTDQLKDLDSQSKLFKCLTEMRTASREFVSEIEIIQYELVTLGISFTDENETAESKHMANQYGQSFRKMQKIFRRQIKTICDVYDLDICKSHMKNFIEENSSN